MGKQISAWLGGTFNLKYLPFETTDNLVVYQCTTWDITTSVNMFHFVEIEEFYWRDNADRLHDFYCAGEDGKWVSNFPRVEIGDWHKASPLHEPDNFIAFVDSEQFSTTARLWMAVCKQGSHAEKVLKVLANASVRRYDAKNLMDRHPDGFGKHILVYRMRDHVLENAQRWIEESIGDYEFPFTITWGDEEYLVIFTTDLTNSDVKNPTVEHISERLNGDLKYYLDTTLEYMGWSPESIKLNVIGYKGTGL